MADKNLGKQVSEEKVLLDSNTTTKTTETSSRKGNVQIVLSNVEPPLSDFQLEILDAELAGQKWGVQATIEDVEELLKGKFADEYSQSIYDRLRRDLETGGLKLKYDFSEQHDKINRRFSEYRLMIDSYSVSEVNNKFVSKDDIYDEAGIRDNKVFGKGLIPRIDNKGFLNVPYLNAAVLKSYVSHTPDISIDSHIAYRNSDNLIKFTTSENFYKGYITPLLSRYMDNYYTKDEAKKTFVSKIDDTYSNLPALNRIPRLFVYQIPSGMYGTTLTMRAPTLWVDNSVYLPGAKSLSDKETSKIKDYIVRTKSNEFAVINDNILKQSLGIPSDFVSKADLNIVARDVVTNKNSINSLNTNTYKKVETYTKAEVNKIINDLKTEFNNKLRDNVPVGTIIIKPTDKGSMPGYVYCDGSTLKRQQYPALFAVLGYTFGGSGDNFCVPDFRNLFLRGIGNKSLPFGKKQGDAIRNIVGNFGTRTLRGASKANGVFTDSGASWDDGWKGEVNCLKTVNFDASRVVPTADENRPENMAVAFYIKVI